MSYLTSTATGSASTDLGLGFGVPGYAHPLVAPVEWDELTRPGTPLHWVVLNVDNGPGERPDPRCLEATGRLRNAGVRVLGLLDAAHGVRPFGETIADARRHLDWYQADGFILDRCPTERAALPEIRRTVGALRALRDGAHIVLGHGTHPHPGYAENADQLVTFSGPWTEYRWSQVAEWTADYPPSASATSCTVCRAATWTRHCASPAGRAPRRSTSPTAPITAGGPTLGDDARLLGRDRLADRNGCLGMKKGVAVLRGEQL